MNRIFLLLLVFVFSVDAVFSDISLPVLKSGTFSQVRKLAITRTEVSDFERGGQSLLHIALQNKQSPEVIRYLLELGAGLDALDSEGKTPLLAYMTYAKDPAIVDTFVNRGASLEAIDGYGRNALFLACAFNCDLPMVKKLETHGFDLSQPIETRYNGFTFLSYPLHEASMRGKLPLVKYLLSKLPDGATIKDSSGNSAFAIACRDNPDVEVAKFLLDAGSDLNVKSSEYENVLFWACNYNHSLPVINFLLTTGLPFEGRTTNIVDSSVANSPDVFQGCLAFYLNHSTRDLDWNSLLMDAVYSINSPAANLVEILKRGADPKFVPTWGTSALMQAVWFDESEKIKTLLKAGAQIDFKDPKGKTAIFYCAEHSSDPATLAALIAFNPRLNLLDENGKDVMFYLDQNTKLKGTKEYWKLKDLAASQK